MGLFSSDRFVSHFPPVTGSHLDGRAVTLPDDLDAEATLLVVLFQDSLDPLADQWARLGDRLAADTDGRVATLELPVYRTLRKLLGELALLLVEPQIDSEAERARTVALFVDRAAFMKSLGVADPSEVYAFLVARGGKIAWRGRGEITMAEVRDLEAAVQALLDGAAAHSPSPDG
jgi:hypothetical protein